MSFISTYDAASIRGWQSTNSGLSYAQVQTLTPANITVNNYYFGNAISLSADSNYLAVGAIEFTANKAPGQCYIYKKDTGLNTFTLEQQFTPNSFSGNTWYFFGQDVDINETGNILVVGAPGYDTSTSPIGATYVYTRTSNTWTEQVRILSGDANSTSFGVTVSINEIGDLIAVGAEDNETVSLSGAVYMYTGSGNSWTKIQKIKSSDPTIGSSFGTALDLSDDGNYLAIGAPNLGTGAVYIFSKSGNTFIEQQKLTSNSAPLGARFGHSVSLNEFGNICVIGQIESSGNNIGNTYVYSRSGNSWSLTQRLEPGNPAIDDDFGFATEINHVGNIVFSSRIQETIGFEKTSSYQEFQAITPTANATANLPITSITCDSNASFFICSAIGVDIGNVANVGSVYIFHT